MKFSRLALALAAVTFVTPAAAQDVAPADRTAPERWVGVNAYPLPEGPTSEPTPENPLLRRAELVEEPQDLLTASDAIVQRWIGGEGKHGGLTITVAVAADGAIGPCTGKPGLETSEADVAAVCDIVLERGTFLPALAADGTTSADTVEIPVMLINQVPRDLKQDGPVRRYYMARTLPTVGPPPVGVSWPFTGHQPFWNKPNKTGVKAIRGVSAPLPDGAVWAAVFVGDGSRYTPTCRVIALSPDRSFRDEACAWVAAQFKPRWPSSADPNNRAYPYFIVKDAGVIRIYEPGFDKGTEAAFDEATRAPLRDGIAAIAAEEGAPRTPTFRVVVDGDGRVARCAIARTGGTNAGDQRSCALVRELARFTPKRDIFGLPARSYLSLRP